MNILPVLCYRLTLCCFVVGPIVSGLTAFPLLTELRVLAAWLGIENSVDYTHLTGLQHWNAFVLLVLEQAHIGVYPPN